MDDYDDFENAPYEEEMTEKRKVAGITLPEDNITKELIQHLAEARKLITEDGITKGGKAGGKDQRINYDYYELADFLPRLNKICSDLGLLPVVRYDRSNLMAYMTVFDGASGGCITFNAPMAECSVGSQAIQGLGAMMTYVRRYLYLTAFEIVEADKLDAGHLPDGTAAPKDANGVPEGVFDEEKEQLLKELAEMGTNLRDVMKYYKTNIREITPEQLKSALDIKKKTAAKEKTKKQDAGSAIDSAIGKKSE